MSNLDIFIEMLRLTEQMGNVEFANMYDSNFISIDGKTKAGKKFSLSLSMREEEKNGN